MIPVHFFEDPPGAEESGPNNPIGWTFWSAVGAAALYKYRGTAPIQWARGAAARLWGRASNPVQTFRAMQRGLSAEGRANFLHRPLALADELDVLSNLARRPDTELYGIHPKELWGPLEARTRLAKPGAPTIADLLAGNVPSAPYSGLRRDLGRIQTGAQQMIAAASTRGMPARFEQQILRTPIDEISTVGGVTKDVRSKWGLIPHLLDKADLPGLYMPMIGRLKSMEKPVRWLADLLTPTGLIRDQRHAEAFFDPAGFRYLKLAKPTAENPSANVIRKMYAQDVDTDEFLGSEMGLLPSPAKIRVGKEVAKNASLVDADTTVGKGIRRRWTTEHPDRPGYRDPKQSLKWYMADMGMNPNSYRAKVLGVMGRFGIGPQFSAPTIKSVPVSQQFPTGEVAERKLGVLGTLMGKPYEWATGGTLSNVKHHVSADIPGRSAVWLEGSPTERNVRGVSDFFNFMVLRPSTLLEELTGFGFQAGRNPVESIYKILTRVALPGWLGFQWLRYADYKAKEVLGTSPSEAAMDTWVGLQMSIAGIREASLVREISDRAEEQFPGVVSSPLAAAARAGLGFFLGAKLGGAASAITGGLFSVALPTAGAALGGAILGPDPREKTKELADVYSGEKLVDVRRGRFWELGKCIAASVDIPTGYGDSKKASDIQVGDLVWSNSGDPTKVVAVYEREHTGKILCFHTNSDRITETVLTGNHVVPVIRHVNSKSWTHQRGAPVEMVEASTIRKGDYVQVPIRKLPVERRDSISVAQYITSGLFFNEGDLLVPAQRNWAGGVQRSRGASIPSVLEPSRDLGLLFGYFLAEGNLSYNRGLPYMVEFVFAKHETEYVDDIFRISQDLFGVTPTKRFKTTGTLTKEGCWIVRICSSLVARFFFGLFYEQLGQDKHVPEIFFEFPDEFLSSLIEGYHVGDGHVETKQQNTRLVIKSARLRLAKAIHTLLLSMGHRPTLVHNGCVFEGRYFDAYRVSWSPVNRYQEVMGYLLLENGDLYTAVTSIEERDYSGLVYDYTVEDEEHLFLAGGFVVHNSGWFGSDIQYQRPHMIPLLKSGYEEKASYGSMEEYFEYGTWAPNPENLFGLKKLLNPNYAAERNKYTRPYPQMAGMGGDIPIVGPVIEGLYHSIFGITLHPLLEESMGYVPPRRMGGERFLPGVMYGESMAEPETAVSRFRPDQVLGKQMSWLQDWFGLPGFLFGAIKGATVGGGTDSFAQDMQLESSERMTDTERWWYEVLNPGGALLTSELFRRFIPHRRRQIELYNPIPNQAPDWLPGSRSAFEGDRDFFIDYHRGDPYSKIPAGEVRLPGAGYESARPLHSGQPGEYSAIDRFMVLSDIAPWSQAYKHYKAVVDTWSQAGIVDEEWNRRIAMAKQRSADKLESRQFGTLNPNEVPGIESIQGTISKVTGPTTFRLQEFPGQSFRLAGLQQGGENAAQRMVADYNASTLEQARETVQGLETGLQQHLKGLTGRPITLQLAQDEAARYQGQDTLAIIPGVNEEFYRSALGDPGQQGLANYLRAGPATRAIGNLWYDIASTDLPFPFGWPKNKLMPIRDPISDYYEFHIKSKKIALWEEPIEGYLKPWARSWIDWVTPGDMKPPEIEQQQLLDQRFSVLSYMKASSSAKQAQEAGDSTAASIFNMMAKRTMPGFDALSSKDQAMYARSILPETESTYLDQLRNLPTTAQRERALRLFSPTMGYVLSGGWKQDLPQGVNFESPLMQWAAAKYEPSAFRQAAVADVLQNVELPGNDWAAWDPQVNMNAARIKYIESIGENIHNFGLWESEARQYKRQFPDLPAPEMLTFDPSLDTFHSNLHRLGMDSRLLGYSSSFGGPSIRTLNYRHDNMGGLLRSYKNQDYRYSSGLYNYQ